MLDIPRIERGSTEYRLKKKYRDQRTDETEGGEKWGPGPAGNNAPKGPKASRESETEDRDDDKIGKG